MLGMTTPLDIMATRAPGDRENLTPYIRALAGAGYPLLLVDPLTKAPVRDLRTTHMIKADDEQARQEAKARGVQRWEMVKSMAGHHLATTSTARLTSYLARYIKRYAEAEDPHLRLPNLGLKLTGRQVLVIDADHAEGVQAFSDQMEEWGQDAVQPTVLTPGTQVSGGDHADGGHFYIALPDHYQAPETAPATFTVGSGKAAWDVKVHSSYVLIPPSERPDGCYEWCGDVREAPAELLGLISERASVRAEAAERRAERTEAGLDAWSAAQSWGDLLGPDGWTDSGHTDSCGCMIWTRPGDPGTYKSATAHDAGCTHMETSYDHGPLHVWTDAPPAGIAAYMEATGKRTLSKGQYLAWTRYDGDMAAMCAGEGVPTSETQEDDSALVQAVQRELAEQADETEPAAPAAPTPPAPPAPPTPPTGGGGSSEPEEGAGSDYPWLNPDGSADARKIPRPSSPDYPRYVAWREAERARQFASSETYPKGHPYDPDLITEIFSGSEILQAIHTGAVDQGVPPMGALAKVMCEVGMRIPVHVRPMEGANHSLMWALVAPPGGSKTRAREGHFISVGDPHINTAGMSPEEVLELNLVRQAAPWRAVSFGVASHQQFEKSLRDGTRVVAVDEDGEPLDPKAEGLHNAWANQLLTVDEMSHWDGKGDGWQIFQSLCSVYSNASMGSDSISRGVGKIEAGTVSAHVIGGIQPGRAGFLLKQSDLGFTQRALFILQADARTDEQKARVPRHYGASVRLPIFPATEWAAPRIQSISDDLQAGEDLASLGFERHDAHAVSQAAKLALVHAVMHGELAVTEEGYRWAKLVQEHDLRQKAAMQVVVDQLEVLASQEEGRLEGFKRAAAVATAGTETSALHQALLRHIMQAGGAGITPGALKQKVTPSQRSGVGAGLQALAAKGWVQAERVGRADRWTLSPAGAAKLGAGGTQPGAAAA